MPSKTQSILLGGLVAGLLSTSYLGLINVACCAGVIIGAVVAVWHYTNTYGLTIPGGRGAAMGALAGVLGAVIGGLLEYIVGLVGIPTLQEIFQGLFEGFMTEEQLEQMEARQELANNPVALLISIAISALIYAIFGAIGGVIGAAVFKKGGDTPAAPPPTPGAPTDPVV